MKKKELIFFMSKKTKIVAIQGDKLKIINKDTDTSLLLALEAQRRGYKIYYYETKNLNYINGKVQAHVKELKLFENNKKFYKIVNQKFFDLSKANYILMRQNPPFNMNYITATFLLEKISKKYKIQIALAPPHHLLASIKKSKLLVFAQHLDDAKVGSTTGYMIPELVKKSKVSGALINHSEHRISPKEIMNLVKRLKKLKMKTVVCVKNVHEAEKYAKLNPTYIAIEPPELIGTGRAISTERPGLITKSLSAVKKARNSTKLLCGAGIVTAKDVKRAMELGSYGILVASGIVKSRNWQRDIEGFAKAIL